MALTVEDGSIVAGADSYVTLAEYQAYAALYGWTLAGTDAADEVNLRIARRYLDNAYSWKGAKVQVDQPLAWPRYMGDYVDGFIVPSDEIPDPIKNAQMEMAYLVQNGADPYATITGGTVKRKKEKVDVIEEETEYFEGSGLDRDSYPLIDQMVGAYVSGKAGGRMFSIALTRG